MAEPLLKVPSAAQQSELERIDAQTAEIMNILKTRESQIDAEIAAWEKTLTAEQIATAGPAGLIAHFALDEIEGDAVHDQVHIERVGKLIGTAKREVGRLGQSILLDGSNYVDAGQVGNFETSDKFSVAAWINLTSNDASTVLSKIDEDGSFRGYDLIMEGGKVAAHFVNSWPDKAFKVMSKQPISLNQWHHIAVTYDGSLRATGVRIFVDGAAVEFDVPTDNALSDTLKTSKSLHIGQRQHSAGFKGSIDDVQLYSAQLSPDDVASLAKGPTLASLSGILKFPAAHRSESQQQQLRQYYADQVDAVSKQLRNELAEFPKRREEIEKNIPATMVMSEPKEPRPAFILKRGQYDQRGEQVESALPHVLNAANMVMTDSQSSMSRLDLARWLTNPDHPLTARVAVNRWWEMLFGTGLVETAEDFGIQGSLPSHPELLDWLATELIAREWDQKAVLKQIVLSATYRQSSRVTPELLERDPRNHLLTRGPRHRLSAETVRDNALFVSGLLKEHIGGPSVKPYQPEGLWEDVSVERRDKYVPDAGEGLYRRSMYTFWKRTCPPPGMSTFDAPDRETCLVRRARTNTPLQALVLLNDPTFVEAARKLAERSLLASDNDEGHLRHAFRVVLARLPEDSERAALLEIIAEAREHFVATPAAADQLLATGNSPGNAGLKPTELAAWTIAMSVLLNIDEAISKP